MAAVARIRTPLAAIFIVFGLAILGAGCAKSPQDGTGSDLGADAGSVVRGRVTARKPPMPLPGEVRALWIKKKTLGTPEEIVKAVEDAKSAGFNTLIAQVRARGDAMYGSEFAPRAAMLDSQDPAFDPLALLIKEAHARGLTVHAWLNTFFVAGCDDLPSNPAHVCNVRPDWLMAPREHAEELWSLDPSDPAYKSRLVSHARARKHVVEGLYLSPANPDARQHLHDVWLEVATRYDVDGLHFDFVRYPGPDFDYSRSALTGFRAYVLALRAVTPERFRGAPDVAEVDPLTLTKLYPGAWDEFRREQVTELVARISKSAKAAVPGITISAAVFPDGDDAANKRYQDWRLWARKGYIDVVCPMAYSTDTAVFAKRVAEAKMVTHNARVWAGIGAWRLEPEGTVDKIRAARELGTGGFVLFSYETLGTEVARANRTGNGNGGSINGYLERIRPAVVN